MKNLLALILFLGLCVPTLAAEQSAAPAAPAAVVDAAPAVPAAIPAAPAVPATEVAAAAVPPPDVSGIETQNPETFSQKLLAAFQSREWGVAVGLILMLIVLFVSRFMWTSLPPSWLPWLSIGLGIAATAGIDLAAGKVWWRAILAGLTTGAAASGLWSALGKYIFGSNVKKVEESKAETK